MLFGTLRILRLAARRRMRILIIRLAGLFVRRVRSPVLLGGRTRRDVFGGVLSLRAVMVSLIVRLYRVARLVMKGFGCIIR